MLGAYPQELDSLSASSHLSTDDMLNYGSYEFPKSHAVDHRKRQQTRPLGQR
jgi:hypothetical protein